MLSNPHHQMHIHDTSLCGAVAYVLDSDIMVTEFELQADYYIYFQIITPRKGMNPLFPCHELNSTNIVLLKRWFWH